MSLLKATYESKEEIPSGLEGYFKEEGGSFVLQAEGIKTQKDVDRAMAAMEKQKQLRIDAEKKLSDVPDDFDSEKWGKLKDLDPDNLPSGDKLDPNDEKEFNKRVSEAVREKEREIKSHLEEKYNSKLAEVEQKEKSILNAHKENWIKNQLAEKFGFSDNKRLRWMMLDIDSGQYPELKKKLESISIEQNNGTPEIVGGDLKDKQGALEILENIANSDVSKDYKPATDNTGGGAQPTGGGGNFLAKSKKDFSSVKEKSKFVAENGLDAWKNLPNE